MDVNLLGLIGGLIRLIIVFRFNYKKQQAVSEKNFEREEKKNIIVGSIVTIILVIWGILTYSIKW